MTKHQDPGVPSMTWLSRLVPQGSGLHRLADLNHRTRQGKRRRRMANLEFLEDRTLLSNVTLSGPTSAGVLTLTFDRFSDNVTITENGDTNVTVTGNSNTVITPPVGAGFPNNSVAVSGVRSIVVNIQVGSSTLAGNNFPSITLNEDLQDGATLTRITNFTVNVGGALGNAPNVSLSVNGVVNPGGAFTVADQNGGMLNVTVANSQFQSLNINQQGCCQATVALDSDIIPGPVTVSEGVAAGDQILVDQNTAISPNTSAFGSTTFIQGAGPAVTGATPPCDGAGDQVLVDNAKLKDLTIKQLLDGDSQQIFVGVKSGISVALTSIGILAAQGNGNNDQIELYSISTSGQPLTSEFQAGPDSITTSQGNGANDQTTIVSAIVYGSITTSQGEGENDSTTVDSSVAALGNIESTQLNGNNDFAAFYGDSCGYTTPIGTPNGPPIVVPFVTDYNGLMQIIQGNGYSDTATLDCNQIENPVQNVANN